MLQTEKENQRCKERYLSFRQKINRLLTKRNQGILFLFSFVLAAAAIFDAVTDFFPEPVSITLYVLAAAGFVLICSLWVKVILFFVNAVLLPFTKSNQIANTLMTDSRLRTVLTTLPGMGLNLIYAVFNGVVGIMNRSAWYGSLSAYYLLLCAMRFLAVSYAKKIYSMPAYGRGSDYKKVPAQNSGINAENRKKRDRSLKEREWRVYRNCGIMLSVMSIALGGAVIMLVSGKGGKSYPGLMIYAIATYTFYKLTMSIINMVKVRKEKSLLLRTLRNIGYSDSLVSLLSLQTALLEAFGQNAGDFVPLMNALTGAAVCLMVSGLGIYMVQNAKKIMNTGYSRERRTGNGTHTCS